MAAVSMLKIAELFVGVANPISNEMRPKTCIMSEHKAAEARLDNMMEVVARGQIRQISAFAKKSTIKVQSLALNRWVLWYIPRSDHRSTGLDIRDQVNLRVKTIV